MAGDGKHCQFFRVRAPVGLVNTGAGTPWTWIVHGFLNVDFSLEHLVFECALIGRLVSSFSYTELANLPFDVYDRFITEMKKVVPKDKNG